MPNHVKIEARILASKLKSLDHSSPDRIAQPTQGQTMNARDNWPRPYWRCYARRYPSTPRARHFQEGWGSYKAWYQVKGLNIFVKQLLRTGGNVVVYVTGEKWKTMNHPAPDSLPTKTKSNNSPIAATCQKHPQQHCTPISCHYAPEHATQRTGTKRFALWKTSYKNISKCLVGHSQPNEPDLHDPNQLKPFPTH